MAIKRIAKSPKDESCEPTLAPDGSVQYSETQLWHILIDSSTGVNDWQAWTTTTAMLGTDPNGNRIPLLGTLHPLLPEKMRVVKVTCKRTPESPWLFLVTVNYGPIPVTAGDKWYIDVRVTGVERTADLHHDLDTNKPIVNSAGHGFDPPVKTDYYDEKIEVKYHANSVDYDLISSLRGCISTAPVTMTIRGQSRTFPAKTLKLVGADYSTQIGNGIAYWDMSLVLHYRTQLDTDGNEVGHIRQIVDRGFVTKNPSWTHGDPQGELWLPIKDAHGNDITIPAYLDGAGQQLAPAADGSLPVCVLLPFHIDYTDDLNVLLDGIS